MHVYLRLHSLNTCIPTIYIWFPPQASRLSHRDDAAVGEKAAASLFRKKSAETAAGAVDSKKKSGNKEDTVDTTEGAAAAAAAKRKGEAAGAAETKKTKTNRTPAPSPPGNKKFRDDEKNRTAHPVPFWNRTNWISGRKDGTGSRGGGGGNDALSTKGTPASRHVDHDSTAANASDSCKPSSKRAAGQVSGAGGAQNGGRTASNSSAAAGSASEAAETSKRARQEGRGATNGVAEGVAKVPIRYQFRAGYTNAVRRPVRMRDLL